MSQSNSPPAGGPANAEAADSRSPTAGESSSVVLRGDLVPFDSTQEGLIPQSDEGGEIPDRYDLRERDLGQALVCREAPGVSIHIDRSYAFSEAEARKLPSRSILLDGAGAFGPLLDGQAMLFNLDHHQGCSRAFTLATCEQALLLVHQDLELDKGDWTVYANEPDLDTLFAVWVLLNHRRLRQLSPEARDRIVPLIRLEGAIDANGFDLAELCGLPVDRLKVEKERLDQLHAVESGIKRSGDWGKIDLTAYTCDMLRRIDAMVYRASDFQDFASVEKEVAHVEVGEGKVAVVCRDAGGIYDVEKRLKKVWGDRLGIIALEKEPRHYTLRRVSSLAGIELQSAYQKLNLLDPRVDGRPAGKKWGGSDDIGGSPRPTGTGLSAREIAKILKLTYKKPTALQRFQRMAVAAFWPLMILMGSILTVLGLRYFEVSRATAEGRAKEMAAAAAVGAVAAWAVTRQKSRGWLWLYGWRMPAGFDWLVLLPLVIVGALAGGAWLPLDMPADRAGLGWILVAALLVAPAVELCFRGLAHGVLILDHAVQAPSGRWFLSIPNLVVAVLHTAFTAGLSFLWIAGPVWQAPEPWKWGAWIAASLVTALALGAIRERSLSVWPGALALGVGQLAAVVATLWPLG